MLFKSKRSKDNNMVIPSKTLIEELLPIGSVVSVLDIDHRLMIIGIKQINFDDNHEYDYVAVPYPEGQVTSDCQVLFNNNDINEISFIGYQDSERFAFLEKIKNL